MTLTTEPPWVSPAAGIAAWLAMGPPLQFDNDWQLDINTAVAVELMLMTTFLQNTKRRHRQYMHTCAQKLGDLDTELEEQLLGEATVEEVIFSGKSCVGALSCQKSGSL